MPRRYRRRYYRNNRNYSSSDGDGSSKLIIFFIALLIFAGYFAITHFIGLIINNWKVVLNTLIIIAVVVVIIVAVILFFVGLSKKYKNYVDKHSLALAELKVLNETYKFNDVQSFDFGFVFDNENFYNDISTRDYLIYQLQFNINNVIVAINKAKKNKMLFEEYSNKVDSINSFNQFSNIKIPFLNKWLAKRERSIFRKKRLTPVVGFYIQVKLTLTNIRKVYITSKSYTFSESEVLKILDELKDRNGNFYNNDDIWQSICRVERGKVTNKMRFFVYDRDGNKCVKCGSRYNLEVDHIYPISKGGKSTPDNLQTLCHDCNVKKSNIIEVGVKNPAIHKLETGEICPLCGGKLIKRFSKRGSFIGCTNFPNCKFTKADK